MDRISVDDIVKAADGALTKRCGEDHIEGVKHDSRQCGKGDMFVAIEGENNDGHDFIQQALDRGCRTLLVSRGKNIKDRFESADINIIEVDDTVYAMGQLAGHYLDTLDAAKVAVTGSVGKTTVRDMIYYTLSERYKCGRNLENFNNDIGLPLSIFQFDSSMDIVVLEMGMNHFGEIERLSEIVRPNVAVITNIGVAHVENLGSREGVFKAKMEITDHMAPYKGKNSVLVFPRDDEFLTEENTRGEYEQIIIGEDGRSDYIISNIDDFGLEGIQFTLEHDHETRKISVPVPGRSSAVNGAIAIAVGGVFGMTEDDAAEGLAKTEMTGHRLKLLKSGKLSVIDDTYNASPDSMKSSLKVLEQSRCSGKKTAVLGDMYELGEQSRNRHFEVGIFARGLDIDRIIAVGKQAVAIAEGARGGQAQVLCFEEKEALYKELSRLADAGDVILVKGSRGMKMEDIVEKFLEI